MGSQRQVMAGLLACGSSFTTGLPGFPVANMDRELAAHSCGGSSGFDPREVAPDSLFIPLSGGTIIDSVVACRERVNSVANATRAQTPPIGNLKGSSSLGARGRPARSWSRRAERHIVLAPGPKPCYASRPDRGGKHSP